MVMLVVDGDFHIPSYEPRRRRGAQLVVPTVMIRGLLLLGWFWAAAAAKGVWGSCEE